MPWCLKHRLPRRCRLPFGWAGLRCYTDILRNLQPEPRRFPGEVAEWLKAHAWKACLREIATWVRIPPSPPSYAKASDGRPSTLEASNGTPQDGCTVWYVYVLKSSIDGKHYVGSTNDLKRRMREHNDGMCDSTRYRRPLELEAYIAVRDESTARSLESYLKTGSGIATLRKRILTSEVPRT